MKRITVEEVKAAYEATRLTPARTVPGCVRSGCACGLGAMWAVAGYPRYNAYTWAKETFGSPYMRSFYQGFDWHSESASVPAESDIGFKDGRAAAAAVFSEASP